MTLSPVTLIKSELFRQGGLEKYTWQIAADFCALGAPITVLTSGDVIPPFEHPQMKIVSLPVSHKISVINVLHFDRACNEYLMEFPTPVIFSLDRNRFQTHIRAGNGVHAAYLQRRAKEEGVIKQLTFSMNPLHHAILTLEKKGFEHPDLKVLFTNSEMVKKEILQFYHTDPEKIRVVHNGVEWNKMQSAFDSWESEKEKSVREWGLDPKAFQFLFVGHNFRRKGLEKLLNALSLLKSENFQLTVIGKEKNFSYFQALVHRLGLSKKVFLLGPQKEMMRFYQTADCLVIPSLYDPFANVTVEALAMGLFVVSSKTNGGHEVLSGLNGAVIDSLDDPKSFADALKIALKSAKTKEGSESIRQTVKHLDFSRQIRLITGSSVK